MDLERDAHEGGTGFESETATARLVREPVADRRDDRFLGEDPQRDAAVQPAVGGIEDSVDVLDVAVEAGAEPTDELDASGQRARLVAYPSEEAREVSSVVGEQGVESERVGEFEATQREAIGRDDVGGDHACVLSSLRRFGPVLEPYTTERNAPRAPLVADLRAATRCRLSWRTAALGCDGKAMTSPERAVDRAAARPRVPGSDSTTIAPLARASHALCAILFLVGITAPAFDFLLRPADGATVRREGRVPALFPPFPNAVGDVGRFARGLETWHRDYVGLRTQLLTWRNKALVLGLRVPATEGIAPGSPGWLFFVGEGVLEDHRGTRPFTAEELDRRAQSLVADTRQLAARGIRLVRVIVPNKESIYPEYLPSGASAVGPTRLDQLAERMARTEGVDFLDLRPALLAEKAHDEGLDWTYFPEGSHWTPRGAWAGSEAILARITTHFAAIRPLPREAYARPPYPPQNQDSLGHPLLIDWPFGTHLDFVPKSGFEVAPGALPYRFVEERLTERGDPSLPRVVLLHDSFGPALQPFLAQHCERLRCIWSYSLSEALIAREDCDVVVILTVERSLEKPDMGIQTMARGVALEEFLGGGEVLWTLTRDSASLRVLDAGEPERFDDPRGGGFKLTAGKEALAFELPALPSDANSRVRLRLAIDCEEATICNVFYSTLTNPAFTRMQILQVPLVAGANDVAVDLPREFGGKVRIRPGGIGANFALRTLEVRRSPATESAPSPR